MRIYSSFLYQLREQRNALFIYYCVVLAGMLLVPLIIMPFTPGESDFLSTNGVTAVTTVFAFIASLCSFKDSFLMNLQHGVSRRSQFIARLGVMGTICAIMALADEVYTLIVVVLQAIFPDNFLAASLYEMFFCSHPGAGSFAVHFNITIILFSVIFSFFILLATCSFGYLITVLNYRLNKIGKIIFWVGVPVLFSALISYCTAHPYGKVSLFFEGLFLQCFRSFPWLLLVCTLITAVCSALTWLLMRRAAVK